MEDESATQNEAEITIDPEQVILTCLNCGAKMSQRACKLICECGYYASCSDYY